MRKSCIQDVVAVILSAFLVTLSFPKFDLGLLAWVALVPLFLALKNRRPKAVFFLAFFTGALSMMGVFFWINFLKGFGWIDFILLAIYMGSFYGFFGLSYNLITRKIRLSPIFSIP